MSQFESHVHFSRSATPPELKFSIRNILLQYHMTHRRKMQNINHVNMQHRYVNMTRNYINMQNIFFEMQGNYVNMRLM